MQTPPAGHAWELLGANVALDPKMLVHELGEGYTFVLLAMCVPAADDDAADEKEDETLGGDGAEIPAEGRPER